MFYASNHTEEYGNNLHSCVAISAHEIVGVDYVAESEILNDKYKYTNQLVIDSSTMMVREKYAEEHELDLQREILVEVRERRDELLAYSDRYVLPDFDLLVPVEEIIAYRKELKDLPGSINFKLVRTFSEIQWPEDPQKAKESQ